MALAPDNAPAGERTRLALSLKPTDVDAALEAAVLLGAVRQGEGSSARDLWEALATLAAIDLGVARTIEPHLDALGILEQAGLRGRAYTTQTWGVFAAEGGDEPLRATEVAGSWTLSGTKPWCSLANRLDRALVTAHLTGGDRALFAVDLSDPGIAVIADSWVARGLTEIPSGPVSFDNVPGTPVGEPGWYLTRPGFAIGGIGVAACWFGGAVAIARTVFAASLPAPSPILAMHLGKLDGMIESARRALSEAADLVDADAEFDGSILAKRVRAAVALACEGAIAVAAHSMGPAPLAMDAAHAKRVADLQLYVRQHHAEKDDASLGTALVAAGAPPW